MTIDWQNILALTAVMAAAIYLARHAWTQLVGRRPIKGCNHCAACPGRADTGHETLRNIPLVELSSEVPDRLFGHAANAFDRRT
jgi:hypothetical protein